MGWNYYLKRGHNIGIRTVVANSIMVNYSQGKIYKITSLHTEQCYVGSTCEPALSRRLAGHRGKFKRFREGKAGRLYTAFKILELGDYKIELLEACPCENRDELSACEGKWIRELDCVNKHIAGRDQKQWRVDNDVAIKQYRADNAVAIKQSTKQYRADNAVAIKQWEKQYYEDNAVAIRAKQKLYKRANRDKINAQQRVRRALKKAQQVI